MRNPGKTNFMLAIVNQQTSTYWQLAQSGPNCGSLAVGAYSCCCCCCCLLLLLQLLAAAALRARCSPLMSTRCTEAADSRHKTCMMCCCGAPSHNSSICILARRSAAVLLTSTHCTEAAGSRQDTRASLRSWRCVGAAFARAEPAGKSDMSDST